MSNVSNNAPAGRVVVWKVIVGAVLVFIELKITIAPGPNLLKASNPAQATGMMIAAFIIAALGLSLVWSGIRPALGMRDRGQV